MITSYHTIADRHQIAHKGLDAVGLIDGHLPNLAVDLNIDPNAQNVFLNDVCRLPEAFMDSVHEQSITIIEKAGKRHISLSHPGLDAWFAQTKAFYLAYSPRGIRIVRLDSLEQGPCVKQTVLATLITTSGEVFVGSNRCLSPQSHCPREQQNMPSGEGYHLCKSVCQQVAHAEVDAITQAGRQANGSTLYLDGHHYACHDCREKSAGAATRIQVVIPKGKSFTFKTELDCPHQPENSHD